MRMIALKRIIKGGFLNFKRSGLVSWAAVLVVTITLSVITLLIFLQAVLHFSLNQIKDKVDVTIYFTSSAPENNILLLKSSLEKLPEVSQVFYTNAEDNLKNFRLRHSNDYPTIQALDEIGGNPLLPTLGVKAKEISQYEAIANFLKSDNALVSGPVSIIDHTNYHNNKEVISKLDGLISSAQKLGFLVTLLFVIISIIITYNTIRLTIFISKEEIGVMRLVGASKMHVRGPFMIEGAIYGIVATFFTLILFWPTSAWLGRNMTSFLGIDMYDYFLASFFQILIILLLSGVGLGIISSFLAARKYLNK
ncbi:MAG: permease-like cell division protein FtsX [Candidatus Paceibacterota bacterium]